MPRALVVEPRSSGEKDSGGRGDQPSRSRRPVRTRTSPLVRASVTGMKPLASTVERGTRVGRRWMPPVASLAVERTPRMILLFPGSLLVSSGLRSGFRSRRAAAAFREAPASASQSEAPETAPFVEKKQSRPALLLVVRSGSRAPIADVVRGLSSRARRRLPRPRSRWVSTYKRGSRRSARPEGAMLMSVSAALRFWFAGVDRECAGLLRGQSLL